MVVSLSAHRLVQERRPGLADEPQTSSFRRARSSGGPRRGRGRSKRRPIHARRRQELVGLGGDRLYRSARSRARSVGAAVGRLIRRFHERSVDGGHRSQNPLPSTSACAGPRKRYGLRTEAFAKCWQMRTGICRQATDYPVDRHPLSCMYVNIVHLCPIISTREDSIRQPLV